MDASNAHRRLSNQVSLITLKVYPRKGRIPLTALVDTGASNNFIRSSVLKRFGIERVENHPRSPPLVIILANGATVETPRRSVKLRFICDNITMEQEFIVMDLNPRFDLVFGLPWFKEYDPKIDWETQSVKSYGKQKSVPVRSVAKDATERNKRVRFSLENEKVRTGKESRLLAPTSSVMTSEEQSVPEGQAPMTEEPTQTVYLTVEAPEMSRDTTSEREMVNTISISKHGRANHVLKLDSPPRRTSELCSLPEMSREEFKSSLLCDDVEQVCWIVPTDESIALTDERNSFENDASTYGRNSFEEFLLAAEIPSAAMTKKDRVNSQGWESLRDSPFYGLLREFEDIFPEEVPSELPHDKGTRHEIDLVPGTKYCVTRQWPLPPEQVRAIDDFFEKRRKAGQVRESKSPHTSPTFCVKKATGGWRIVHAFNKLNDATIPAQTPIPRKDVIIDGMQGSTIFSTLDLRDGFYQILMREKDIPLTAVSTPGGMLWEWLVMPQGLKNAPATFNRCVTHLLRPVRSFAPSYFDDVYIHSRKTANKSDVDVHKEHLRELFKLMRKHKLYANLPKCLFGVAEIPVLGDLVSNRGVRPDPEKIRTIKEWPVPKDIKELRKFLGLSAYLHKYSKNYAVFSKTLTQLLHKEADWDWTSECHDAFTSLKQSLIEAPILMIADHSKPFHVVCDASDFAIGSALMQLDDDAKERVVAYQSRQLKPAEKNYPVHDKELLSMKYALAKFRVYLLGAKPFMVFTDHASLRTAIKSPHLSQRMARWLSFFADYNFTVHYKPGKANVLADALSRRPDYGPSPQETVSLTVSIPNSPLLEEIKAAYIQDKMYAPLLEYFQTPTDLLRSKLDRSVQSQLHRFEFSDGAIYYRTDDGDDWRVLVPDNRDLKDKIMFEYHDAPSAGHRGREKTYLTLSRDFYWPNQYKWVRKYIRTCEVCQRVTSSRALHAPLHSLPVPQDCWQSVSMDFIFGLPKMNGKTGILVFVDRFSKMVHLTAVNENIKARQSAAIFMETVFRLHGLPQVLVSDRDPRFTSRFWRTVFNLLGSKLTMSTTDHPETDGQTERVNRVLVDLLKSYAHSIERWIDFLPLMEFSINNSVHASTGMTPFYVNGLRHPRLPVHLHGGKNKDVVRSLLSEGGSVANPPLATAPFDMVQSDSVSSEPFASEPSAPAARRSQRLAQSYLSSVVGDEPPPLPPSRYSRLGEEFALKREAIIRFTRDAVASAYDKQKQYADVSGRLNQNVFKINEMVLLSVKGLPKHAVSNLGSKKMLPRYIGPFKVLKRLGEAYTLDIPSAMKLHPTFYVGRLKAYRRDGDTDHRSEPPASTYEPSSRLDRDVGPSPSPGTALPTPDSSVETRPRHRPQRESIETRAHRAPPPLVDSSGFSRYVVEKIVSHRDTRTRNTSDFSREYLVRWLGFSPASDSWEPRQTLLEDVPDLVIEYEQRDPVVSNGIEAILRRLC